MTRTNIFFLLLLCLSTWQAAAQNPAYYYLRDAKHNIAIVAGDSYDGRVYHQQPNGRQNAQWRFEPAGDGYYYIFDRKHGKALVAGDSDDNNTYHQAPNGRLNAQWKPIPVAGGGFYFEDKKHRQVFVAGDNADGNIYHQTANGRLNAQWKLEVAVQGTNPAFLSAVAVTNPVKFTRDDGTIASICVALGMSPAQQLPAGFWNAIGTLGMDAAESYFANISNLTPDQALSRITTQDTTRHKILGVLAVLVVDKLKKGGTDAPSVALRDWATKVFRGIKIKAAKGSLDEYKKWKADPCSYIGEGYQKPQSCYGNNPYATMFAMESPPSDLIGKAGLQYATSNTNDMVKAVSTGLTGVSFAATAAATMSGLGVSTGFIGVSGAPILTSLYAAFGGTIGASQSAIAASASIGATSWTGVVAAPIAAAVFAVTVGVTQGLEVYQAAMVEPNLKKELGRAMSEQINIANVLTDNNAASLFFVGFIHAAVKNSWKAPDLSFDGEVTLRCEAGYVSKFVLSYTQSGQVKTFTTTNLSVNNEQSFPIPASATSIVVKGYMISAGEHLVFTQNIPAPTYTCFKTYNTIFNPSWANAWPLALAHEVKFFQEGGYVARLFIDYTLDGQAQNISSGNVTAGQKKTFPLPENAKNVRIRAENATGLAWEPWRTIFDKTYPEAPNVCFKTWGTTLSSQWGNECF